MMPEPSEDFDAGLKRLKVLADPDRLHIAACLMEGSMSATELAEQLGQDIAAVMEHLDVMTSEGFLQREGEGAFAVYSFLPEVSLAALGLGDAAKTIDMGCCKLTLTQISPPDRT
jgi:DNA-binding transcriptional ArsR family regulator